MEAEDRRQENRNDKSKVKKTLSFRHSLLRHSLSALLFPFCASVGLCLDLK